MLFINTSNISSSNTIKDKIEPIQQDMYSVVFGLNRMERSLNNLNDNLIKLDSIKNGYSTGHSKH